ncbi:MAG TPA: bacillithiol biosynthesis cysteine-adding enzyme BshC [Flavipsychrobacter sp.]|nr:bacillithiol biosynthesis cysteine-adding enzyme BshC [Flavipsychrobacter sp.]
MPLSFSYLPYSDTHSFSQLVTDYLSQSNTLKPFYKFATSPGGTKQAIEERKKYAVDRKNLVAALIEQYGELNRHEATEENIDLLADEKTFTVCTAHQPNLLTGYLYFIYKIIHAIKLAEELKASFPEYNFVPVYYMGSEDNDLEELGTFRYNNKKFVWDAAGQTGAVGKMQTESLKPLLDELFKELGPPGAYCEQLKSLITQSYLQQPTIARATLYLVNELFGRYGLIVLDPDSRLLKRSFINIVKDDLLHQTANKIVTQQIAQLSENYKVQAYPRPINLFYLKNNIRERIEKTNEHWSVVNTNISWTEEEMTTELNKHPERFSPNVILRGLFQETILPNVAFIGGGAEIAYWLQLKSLFDHYNVFYPAVHLRQSVVWINSKNKKLREQLGFSISDLFKSETTLEHKLVVAQSTGNWQTKNEMDIVEQTLQQLKQKATALDPTLSSSAEAALAKIRNQMQVLEKKMLRAEKRKMHDQLARISKLKKNLFPNNGLQERVENFMEYFLKYGEDYFSFLKDTIQPFKHQMMVAEESEEALFL